MPLYVDNNSLLTEAISASRRSQRRASASSARFYQCRLLAALATAGSFEKNPSLQYKLQDERHPLPSLKQQRCHCTWTTILSCQTLALQPDDPSVERVHPLLASQQCQPLAALATACNFKKIQSLQYKQSDEHHHLPLPKPAKMRLCAFNKSSASAAFCSRRRSQRRASASSARCSSLCMFCLRGMRPCKS